MNTEKMIFDLGYNLENGIIDGVTTLQVLLDNPNLLTQVVETLYRNKKRKAIEILCQARRVIHLENCLRKEIEWKQ